MPLFSEVKIKTPPSIDEFEVSLFGRGVGECLVIHIGNGKWIIIDSHHKPETKSPIAIEYLLSLGADLSDVQLIVVTHWDKDHIGGITEALKQCPNASLCFPIAFTNKDFITFVATHYEKSETSIRSNDFSTNEIHDALATASKERRAIYLSQDRLLFSSSDYGDLSAHALSPTDYEIQDFFSFIVSKLPAEGELPLRASDKKRNFLSSVVLFSLSNTSVLLSADMMSSDNRNKGWAAIIDNSEVLKKIRHKASVYKVAHHGAESGNHVEVWQKLMISKPLAMLAPYTAGTPLPTRTDIMRLEKNVGELYLTSTPYKEPKIEGRHPTANRIIKERSSSLKCVERGLGLIRLRTKINACAHFPDGWQVETFGQAISLQQLKDSHQWKKDSLPS